MPNAIPHDVQLFLANYSDARDNKTQSANFEFYSNKRRCQPDNVLIRDIHERWKGNYSELEYNHGFIQWLFPIQEPGMNFDAQPLQRHEIATMKADESIMACVLESYCIMMDFYGMQLVSIETGLLARTEPRRKSLAQYRNLVRSSHNNLRISRILKCMSEFGMEHLNAGFVLHVLNEQSEYHELDTPMIKSSMDRWWANCIRNDAERQWIRKLIEKARQEETFVFTRAMYEQALERRKESGKLSLDES